MKGYRFGVWSLGFGVYGFGLWGFAFWFWGFVYWVLLSGFRVRDLRVWVLWSNLKSGFWG